LAADKREVVTNIQLYLAIGFDDMRDLWRAELYGVEEVIDIRLKHLEERR
jgi:hypothetical protein